MWQICQLLNLGPIVSLPQEGLIFDSLSSTKVKKIWFYRALALWQDYDVKCVQTILQEILDWVWKLCQAKVSKVMNNVSKRFFGAIVKIYGAKVDWGFLLHLCMNIGIFPSVSFFCIYSPHFLLYLKQRQLVRYYSNSMSLHLRMLITIDRAHFLLLKQTTIQEQTTPNPCATTLMSQRYQTLKVQFQYLILLKNLSCYLRHELFTLWCAVIGTQHAGHFFNFHSA